MLFLNLTMGKIYSLVDFLIAFTFKSHGWSYCNHFMVIWPLSFPNYFMLYFVELKKDILLSIEAFHFLKIFKYSIMQSKNNLS